MKIRNSIFFSAKNNNIIVLCQTIIIDFETWQNVHVLYTIMSTLDVISV